jgi:hypothetical protein
MKVLLADLDSKLPNVALMKLSAHFKGAGHEVELVKRPRRKSFKWPTGDYDRIYGSLILKRNKGMVGELTTSYPGVPLTMGGPGYDLNCWLPPNIERLRPDYDLYDDMPYSMGFTTRGCVRNCSFCIVREKEGELVRWQHPSEFHDDRFDTTLLLDNNWLADRTWFFETSQYLIDQGIKVVENGLDVRFIDEEIAGRLADIKWKRTIKIAYDSKAYTQSFLRGLNLMKEAGINVRNKVSVYIYMNDNSDAAFNDAWERAKLVIENGSAPFLMFNIDEERDDRSKAFQRWMNRRWLCMKFPFEDYRYGKWEGLDSYYAKRGGE